ncbi:hypothetical protein ACF0H5_024146 [Mactra antiquata]
MEGIFIYLYTVWAVIYLFPVASGSNNKEPINRGIAVRQGEPTVVFAQKHQDLLLNCSVEHDSDLGRLDITWSKDGVTLDLGTKGRLLKYVNGSLYIKRFRHRPKKNETNEGHYRCYASIVDGDTLVGRILARDVQVKVAGIEKKFDIQPQPQNVSVGGTARFQCKIGAVPKAMYIWRRNKTSLPQNDNRYLVLTSGILQITGVTEADAGHYQCYATQVLIHDLPGPDIDGKYSSEALLRVVTGEKLVPKIIASSKNVTADVSSSALLECLIQGYNNRVQWKRNGEIVDIKGSNGRIELIGTNLHILESILSDDGNYECVAGQEKALMRLNIIQKPIITFITESKQIVKSQWMYFECKVEGHPKPSITWLKDGRDIDYTKNVELKDLKDGSQLALTISQEYNSGYYQCIASNEAGSEMTMLRVKVIKTEEAPDMATNLTASYVTNTSIALTWEEPQSEYPAIWYIVHYQKELDKYKEEKVVATNMIELQGLKPASQYEIYVATFNSLGSGPESEHLLVTTLEGVPTRSPEVSLEPRASSILVKWEPLPLHYSNGKITHYKIYIREKNKSLNLYMEDVPATSTSHLLTGLKSEMEYEIRVLASTVIGTKFPLSESLFPWISVKTRNVVAPTLHMSVTPIDSSSINVSWTCETVYTVVSYLIMLEIIPSGQVVTTRNVGANMSHVVFSKLDDSSLYKITVTVTTDNNLQSEAVDEFSFTNVPKLPSPQNVHVSLISTDHVNIEWEQPESDIEILSFTVKYKPAGGVNNRFVESSTDSYLLENLAPYTDYEISVRAKGQKIASPYSIPVKVRTSPGYPSEPQNVEISAVSKDTASVTWEQPAKPNGPVKSYTILYTSVSNRSDELWNIVSLDGTKNSAEIKVEEANAKTLFFKLYASTVTGDGKMSAIVQLDSAAFTAAGSKAEDVKSKINILGIIIGSIIGLIIIIICAFCLCLCRKRCYGEQSSRQTSTQPTQFHGNGHIPGNGNGHAIQMAESPPTVNIYEMDAYTPMLPSLPENEHSDSKGGGDSNVILTPNGAKLNGFVPFKHNGIVNGQVQNGHMTSYLPSQYKEQNIDAEETRGLIAAMLAGSCEQCLTANVGEESFTTSRYEDLGSLDNIDTGSSEDGIHKIHKKCDKEHGNSADDSGEGSLTASGEGSLTVSDRSSSEYGSSMPRSEMTDLPRSDTTDTGDTVVYAGSPSNVWRSGDPENSDPGRNVVIDVSDGESLPIQLPQTSCVENKPHESVAANIRSLSTNVQESRNISGYNIPQGVVRDGVNPQNQPTSTFHSQANGLIDNSMTENRSEVIASHSGSAVAPQVTSDGSRLDVHSHRRRHPASSNGVRIPTTAPNLVGGGDFSAPSNGVPPQVNSAVRADGSQGDVNDYDSSVNYPYSFSRNSREVISPSARVTREGTHADNPQDCVKLSNIKASASKQNGHYKV